MQTWFSRKMPRHKISKWRRNRYRNTHDRHFSYISEKCLTGNTLRGKGSFPFTAWLLSLVRKALRQEGENGQSHRITVQSREKIGLVYIKTSMYDPNNLPPLLPRLCFLKLPQLSYTMLPTGDQVLKHASLWGTFHTQPQQHQWLSSPMTRMKRPG